MKRNLVKAIVLAVIGVLCICRGLCGFRYDDADYPAAGSGDIHEWRVAIAAREVRAEAIRQANDSALQMVAVGTLVLLSASSPWREYRREKAERDALYDAGGDE